MQRAQCDTDGGAYSNLLACAASDKPKTACIDGWVGDAKPLLTDDEAKFARSLLDYYVDNSLRGDKDRARKLCGE